MNRIIQIDENTHVKLLADNFMLRFKMKTRTNRIAWRTEGFYPDMTSLCQSYLNHAPYRAIRATERFEKLLEVVRQAEETLKKLISKKIIQ